MMRALRDAKSPLYFQQFVDMLGCRNQANRNLKVLIFQGFIEKKKKGKYSYYYLTDKATNETSNAERYVFSIERLLKAPSFSRTKEGRNILKNLLNGYDESLDEDELNELLIIYKTELDAFYKSDPEKYIKMNGDERIAWVRERVRMRKQSKNKEITSEITYKKHRHRRKHVNVYNYVVERVE
jgi:hypothetical protein